jgi:hypothetical protein
VRGHADRSGGRAGGRASLEESLAFPAESLTEADIRCQHDLPHGA